MLAQLQPRALAYAGDGFNCDTSLRVHCVRAKPHTLQCAMRTIFNAWPCSGRLPIESSSCVFGCTDGKDSPEHYRHCAALRDALFCVLGERVGDHASLLSHPWGISDNGCIIQIPAILYSTYVSSSRARREGRVPNLHSTIRSALLLHPFSRSERPARL